MLSNDIITELKSPEERNNGGRQREKSKFKL